MKPVKVSGKACRRLLLVAYCAMAMGPLYAQSPAEKVLLAKAQTLVAQGHRELAIQTWQQILLSNPDQREALLGIARADMQLGKTDEAEKYIHRLRDLGFASAELAQIDAMPHVQPQGVRLNEARRLAQQGRYADAIKIYNDLFPHGPPAGQMALEYYQTEAALPELRRQAVDGLRQLATQFSADSRYAIAYGRVLTYDPKTRVDGINLLGRFDGSPEAQQAIREAQSWNGGGKKPAAAATAVPDNPTAAAGNPPAAAEPSAAKQAAADPVEASAYRALNSGQLDQAEQQFQELLSKSPRNAVALTGLGYVAMKRGNFAEAVDYLEKARTEGAPRLEGAITTARFWRLMSQAASEQKAGNADSAAQHYREALALKPGNADAEAALASALMQKGDGPDAVTVLKQEVSASPENEVAWRELFVDQAQTADWRAALATSQRMPRNVQARLEADPEYLRFLIQAYLATNRKQDADRATERALALPFPNQGRDLPLDKQLQYAGLLMTVRRFQPALRLYQQVLEVDPENAGAWRALVAAQHQLGRDDDAIATVRNMSRSAYNQSQNDAGFLALLGSIYQSRNQFASAEKYLEKAVAIAGASQPGIESQLASVYIAQGEPQKAYSIYRGELDRNPNSSDAWRGLLGALHQSNRDREALRELAAMPGSVRLALEQDSSYLQTLASMQSAAGQDKAALQTFSSIMQVYQDQQADPPADMQIQYGWLLLKAADDRRLYSVISAVAQAPDLTADQQANLNQLWASWSVRRANSALAGREPQRGIAILEAAAQAFPGNVDVYNTLAGAYLRTSQPKRALAIYASLDMRRGTLAQYHGAIGAALAAGDLKQAAVWLQTALDLYKDDAALLKMAAQYEQARGDAKRAAAYYRAALEAMGPQSPAEIFSHPPTAGGGSDGDNRPARELLRLLAPSGPNDQAKDQTMDDPDRAEFRREADVEWRNGPRAKPTTLGEFAPSEARVSATRPLRDSIAVEESQAPLKRASLELPPRENGVSNGDQLRGAQVSNERPGPTSDWLPGDASPNSPRELVAQDDTFAQQPLPKRGKSRASNSTGGGANDPEAAEKLQDAVKDMETAPRINKHLLDDDGGRHNQNDLGHFADPSLAHTSGSTQIASSTLPPLTGAIVANQAPLTPREQIEQQLAILEASSSSWVGGTSALDYRSGQPGYDRLAMYSGQAEASGMLGPGARTTFIVKPVLLDAGQATGTETIRQGTLPLGSAPYIQSAAGLAGEFQLQTANFGARIGTTPHGFLVQNYTGGVSIHPASAHFRFDFSRDPILDTQLSFAGLRDEGSVSATFVGNTWGGVISNAGELQINHGDALSGWYIQGGGQYLTGRHVANNERIDGDGGAYWTAWHNPQYGSLVAGMNFFGMHYERNLRYFTYGQGGYFSPGAYMLAAVPLTFNGHEGPRFHYRVTGGLGMQAFQEDSAPYFPLDPSLQAAQGNPTYPERTSVGGNYNLEAEGAYAIADHWYVGAYSDFNNSRDYASDKVGFFVRFLSNPQPANEEVGPTGLFPIQGIRPLQTP